MIMHGDLIPKPAWFPTSNYSATKNSKVSRALRIELTSTEIACTEIDFNFIRKPGFLFQRMYAWARQLQ